MLSRTADHLFWMARYIERADKHGKAVLAAKAHLRAAQVNSRRAGRSQNTGRCADRCLRPGGRHA